MIKQLLAAIIILVIFMNCGLKKASNLPSVQSKISKSDTLIPLTKTVSLYYASYNKDMKLWYNLSIINNKKSTKLIEDTDYQGIGSELFVALSPNQNYVVVDSVIKGYVYVCDKDSTLHENFTCSIIDLKSAKIVEVMQQNCEGRWDKNNQWLSSEGEVVFR